MYHKRMVSLEPEKKSVIKKKHTQDQKFRNSDKPESEIQKLKQECHNSLTFQ